MKSKVLNSIFFVLSCVIISSFATFGRGWTDIGGEWYYLDDSDNKVTETIKASDGLKYYLDENGIMARDYLLEDYNGAMYYFDDTGVMVKDTWVAVDPSQTSEPIEGGPTVYLFYFGSNGKAYKAESGCVKKTIDGKNYLFDEQGRMLSGWITAEGEMYISQDASEDPFLDEFIYYAGDETDGVLREGWMEYTDGSLSDDYYDKLVMWFYFNPNTNKKIRYDGSNGNSMGDFYEKRINGSMYAFDFNGVMMTGWDAVPATRYYVTYEDDEGTQGQMVKKNWVYAVPSEVLNKDDYEDDVMRWFYANNSGDIVKGVLKKVNKNEYVFDNNGIMKTDLVVLDKHTKKYLYNIDSEGTDGKKFLTERIYYDKDLGKEADFTTTEFTGKEFDPDKHILAYFNDDEESEIFGARTTGKVTLAFLDDDYEFVSDKKSEYEGYKKSEGKAIYQFGIKLKADPLIGYGLVLEKMASPSTVYVGSGTDDYNVTERRVRSQFRKPSFTEGTVNANEYHAYFTQDKYDNGDSSSAHWAPVFRMVDDNGKIYNKRNTAKKDRNNNYWIIDNLGYVAKIVSVPVRYRSQNTGSKWEYKSTVAGNEGKDDWIKFDVLDQYGSTIHIGENGANESTYDIKIDESYCLNFVIDEN